MLVCFEKGTYFYQYIFTESAPRPIQSINRDVCEVLSPAENPASRWTEHFLSKILSLILAKIEEKEKKITVSSIFCVLKFVLWV